MSTREEDDRRAAEERRLAAAEREAERQRALVERQAAQHIADTFIIQLNKALGRADSGPSGTEMGQGPELPDRSHEARMLELKRQQLERGLTAPVPGIQYDSPERRQAIADHLREMKLPPHLAEIRDLIERSNAEPPQAAVERRPDMTNRNGPARGRGTERDAPGRER